MAGQLDRHAVRTSSQNTEMMPTRATGGLARVNLDVLSMPHFARLSLGPRRRPGAPQLDRPLGWLPRKTLGYVTLQRQVRRR
jgi:hypothetical protein